MKTFWFSNLLWFKKTEHLTCLQQFTCKRMQYSKLVLWKGHHLSVEAGADPGFILWGVAVVSCSTSTPINHIVFFCRIPVVLENQVISGWGGRGGAHPLHPPPKSVPEKVYGRGIFSFKNGIYKGMGLDFGTEHLRIKFRSVPPGVPTDKIITESLKQNLKKRMPTAFDLAAF